MLDTHAIGYFPSAFVASVPLSAFFLTSQMFVKLTSSSLVGIDVLVNPFMTNVDAFMLPHPQRDLLWTPIFTDPFLNPGPGLRLNALPVPFTSIYSVAVGLFRPISSLTLVPFQLSADGRFMYSYCFCYFRLFMVTFQKCLNLILLTLGCRRHAKRAVCSS